YQHIELLPVGVFDKSHSGDLVSRLVSDTTEVEKFMEEDVAGFVSNAVTVAGALGLLFLVDQRLTLLVAPACVVLVIVVNLFKPLVQLSKGNLKLQKALAAADRVFELVDRDPEVLETPGSLTPQMIEGRIEFEKVSFSYRPEKNVLSDLSLLIHPGETVAIVG